MLKGAPLEAGLGWAVKLGKEIDFLGKDAIQRQKAAGIKKMLACFTVDDPNVILLGRETIYRNGERVGWLSSGGYGYTLGRAIGYGYIRHDEGVDTDFVEGAEYELEIATKRVRANVHLRPLYDPAMKKIKC